ncbi:NFACT family protein [Thermatribacter velox]|uniref:NFACT family protein n=1 Tax=Thermatribacter velox TaxID=3039681 RepID=A0ABZ2Y9A3_9BACT
MQTLEGLPLRFLIKELKTTITGARIQDVLLLPQKGFALRLYTQNTSSGYLVTYFHPNVNVLFFSSQCPDKKLNLVNHWIQTTKKNLVGGHITEIEQIGWDRVVRLFIRNPSLWESGEKQFYLIFELTGRNANLVLVEADSQRILSAARFIGQKESSLRHILPDLVYSLPPYPEGKLDPLLFWESKVFVPGSEAIVVDGPGWFIRNFEGVGSFLGKYLWRKIGDRPTSHQEIRKAWEEILQPLFKENYKVYLFFEKAHQRPLGIFWKEDGYSDAQTLAFSTFSEAVEAYLRALHNWQKQHALKESRLKELQKELETIRWEKEKIVSSLPDEEEIETTRLKGELLKLWPNLEIVKRDDAGLIVRNIFSPSQEEIHIALDSALSVTQNMQNYFQLYRKLLKRATMAKKKLAILEKRESEILGKLESLAEDSTKIAYYEQSEGGTFSPRRFPPGITGYRTPQGNYILIGKNARANHLLISKVASRKDLWFHARDIPGSHVVLKIINTSQKLREDVERAAKLAAFYSKGRAESSVPIIMTEVKYLRFAPGSDLGKVLFRNEKTLFVQPEFPLGLEAF